MGIGKNNLLQLSYNYNFGRTGVASLLKTYTVTHINTQIFANNIA